MLSFPKIGIAPIWAQTQNPSMEGRHINKELRPITLMLVTNAPCKAQRKPPLLQTLIIFNFAN